MINKRFNFGFLLLLTAFSSIALGGSDNDSTSPNSPATRNTLCSYEVAGPGAAMTALATTLIYDTRNHVLVAPSIYVHSTLKPDKSRETRMVNLVDGGVRIGLGRPANATLSPLSQDIHISSIRSICFANIGLMVRDERHSDKVISAAVSSDGEVNLFVPLHTNIGLRYRREETKAGRRISITDQIAFPITIPEKGKARAVSLIYAGENKLRLFVATDRKILYRDIDLQASKFLDSVAEISFTTFQNRGAWFLKAISANWVIFSDERGNVYQATSAKLKKLGNLGGYPISVDAFKAKGQPLEVWAAVFREGPGVQVVRWNSVGKTFADVALNLPEGNSVVALSTTGIAVDTDKYESWRHEGLYETGYLLDSETLGDRTIARRILMVVRNGHDYSIRGLTTKDGQFSLNEPRWFYIDDRKYSLLEMHLIRAGFDIESLRQVLSVPDIQTLVRDTLYDRYGIGVKYDHTNPATYRGERELILAAWTYRLQLMYHLRLKSAGIRELISEEGVRKAAQRVFVYELMAMHEREQSSQDVYYAILDDMPYDDWKIEFVSRLGSEMSVLVQPMNDMYRRLKVFHSQKMAPHPEKLYLHEFEFDQVPTGLPKLLYLISKYYTGKPYRVTVDEFLNFAGNNGLSNSGRVTALEGLLSYLESIDPLRQVTTSEALLQFLGEH